MISLRAALFLLSTLSAVASAQDSQASRSIILRIDNDLFALRGAGVPPDYDYTHGANVVVAWAGASTWARRLVAQRPGCGDVGMRREGCVTGELAIGQAIYTPRRDAREPVAGERPYAGWLYAAATMRLVSHRRVRSLGAEVGVTGPPSLAQEVQNGVHRLLRNEAQLGWTHQLPTGPGVALRYGESRRASQLVSGPVSGGLALRWAAVVGTVVSAVSAGADLTLGLRGDVPWSPAEPDEQRPDRLYARAGYRQDVVLRNVFVDGGRHAPRAVRKPIVGQADVGMGYRHRRFALEYRHVVRSREYDAQPSPHAYGSIALTINTF